MLIIILACEPYIILKPISSNMDNEFNGIETGYYILEADTIRVNCRAFYHDGSDSTSKYIMVEILTNSNNLRWENIISYLLVDSFNQSLEPNEIERIPVNFSEKWSDKYEIIFKSNEEMKFPLKLQLSTLNQKEYFISFDR